MTEAAATQVSSSSPYRYVDSLLRTLTKRLNNIEKHAARIHENGIFSKREWQRHVNECRWRCRELLQTVFLDTEGEDGRIFQTHLDSVLGSPSQPEVGQPNEFSDGVLFAYLPAPDGDGTAQWRDDFFYEGSRWSRPEWKRAFYFWLRPLEKELSRSNNPLIYLLSGFHTETPCKRLTISQGKKIHYDARTRILTLPGPDYIDAKETKKFFNEIHKQNENTKTTPRPDRSDEDKFSRDLNDSEDSILKLKTLTEAQHEFMKDPLWFKILTEGVRTIRAAQGATKDDDVTPDDALSLWRMIALYQFYDHPYDIHIWIPSPFNPTKEKLSGENDSGSVRACLVMTTCQRTVVPEAVQVLCERLAVALTRLPHLESKLLALRQKHDKEYSSKWNRLFSTLIKPYERLQQHVETLAYALVDATDDVERKWAIISSRVKNKDSTFEKLVEDVNYPDSSAGTGPEILKHRLESGEATQVDTELLKLNDVVGVRIQCAFEEYLYRLAAVVLRHGFWKPVDQEANDRLEFLKRKLKELRIYADQCPADCDFIIRDVRPFLGQKGDATDNGKTKNTKNPYRSLHFILEIPVHRGKLIEYKGLSGRRFELQIRSILMHGWSEVTHDIQYKNDVPETIWKRLKTDGIAPITIHGILQNTSNSLADQDEEFNGVLDLYRKARKLTR